MNPQIQKLKELIDNLSITAKATVLIASVLIILFAWYYLLWSGFSIENNAINPKIKSAEQEIKAFQDQLSILESKFKEKQNAITAMEAEAAKAATGKPIIKEIKPRAITPNEMREILSHILTNKFKLSLLEFKTLPVNIMPNSQQTEIKTYEYGISIKFKGDFLSTVKYLEAIESLKWKLFWDKLEYKVTKYPMAEITLQIHTISNQEGWINV